MFPDPNDERDEQERADRRIVGARPERTDIPFGTDAAGMDAEVMAFEEWRNFYADLDTGLRQYERGR